MAKETIEELKERLKALEETLDAIRSGEVDAIVVKGPKGKQLYSLISPDHPYQVFIENMDEAALIISNEGTIVYSNTSFFKMVGSSTENVIGSSILNFVLENDRPYFMETLHTTRNKKPEFSFITKDKQIIKVLVSVSKGEWKEIENFCLLLTDITKLKRAQQLMEASEAIARILSQAPLLKVAFNSIIQVLKNYFEWDVMVVWALNKEKQALSCLDIVSVPDIDIESFAKKTKEAGIGNKVLSSHPWSSYRPVWEEDIIEDSNFLRRHEALECGLHGALTFPFYQDSQLGGVIELFRRTTFQEDVDDPLLNLITSIGIQMGLYIQKIFTEETKFQLSTVLTHSLSGIYIMDVNGIITSWNPSAEKIYGWRAEEMIGRSIKKIFPLEKIGEFDRIHETLLLNKSIEHFQTQRFRKDGKVIWVDNAYGVINDPFGKISGICVIVHDITYQKNLEENLVESKEKFQSFIEMTEDWIWEIDKNGIITFSNEAILSILGYQAKEVIGKNILFFLSPEEREKIEEQLQANVLQKQGWVHQTLPFIHKKGTIAWLKSNASELLDNHNELIGFRGVSQDLSASKNLEKVKNEFISIVSHELKTPLTSIYGALSLLKTKERTPMKQMELIDTAYRNSVRLAKLINDIMDIEKLQLGKLKFDFNRINLKPIILEAIELSDFMAKKNNVQLIINDPFPDVEVYGDSSRILQVMSNLLSNAIKFSPHPGTVYISVETLNDWITVSIKDHGPGIPKDFQPKVFEMFAQADSSAKRSSEGTGLGLNISKCIIEGHGGTINYVTKPNESTIFFFKLPIHKEIKNDQTT